MNVSGLPPCALIQGDSYSWNTTVPDYPPGAGWTLGITFRSGAVTDMGTAFSALGSGAGYLFTLDSAATEALVVGVNAWSMRVINGADAHTVAAGRVVVSAGLTGAGPVVVLTPAERFLAALEAIGPEVMANGYAQMQFDGALSTFRSLDEYRRAVDWAREAVNREHAGVTCCGPVKTGNRRKILSVFRQPRI